MYNVFSLWHAQPGGKEDPGESGTDGIFSEKGTLNLRVPDARRWWESNPRALADLSHFESSRF